MLSKNILISVFSVLTLTLGLAASLKAFGQNSATGNSSSTSDSPRPSDSRVKYKPKKAVSIDYSSWFEMLKLKTSTGNTETKAHYYGATLAYDYTMYEKSWGYGVILGYAQGYGLAGNSSDAGSFFAKRVPWSAIRVGARVFSRLNNRFDLGLLVLANLRTTKWAAENGYEPYAPVNPLTGVFVETRWRVDYKKEVVQGFGTYTKDSSLAWRVGLAYTLN